MKLLITAGPTREYIDPIRFISNASSGKMGYCLAREAVRRGHQITLVSGPTALKPPKNAELISVVTSAEMARACKNAFRQADAAIMTAAVCDYRPAKIADHKLEKSTLGVKLQLESTEDIAAALGRRKGGRLLVGFAMQDHDHYRLAEGKLARKKCDMIVLNRPENVGVDRAAIEVYTPGQGWSAPILGTKTTLSRRLIRLLENLWDEHRKAGR